MIDDWSTCTMDNDKQDRIILFLEHERILSSENARVTRTWWSRDLCKWLASIESTWRCAGLMVT